LRRACLYQQKTSSGWTLAAGRTLEVGGTYSIADAETGAIVDANRNAEKLSGRSREELAGMNRLQLHPPGEAERYKQHFDEHVRRGDVTASEAVIVRKDGSLVPVRISASVLELNGRKTIHGIFEDIRYIISVLLIENKRCVPINENYVVSVVGQMEFYCVKELFPA